MSATYTVVFRGLGLNADGLLNLRSVTVDAHDAVEAWRLASVHLEYGEYITEVWAPITQTTQFMGA